MRMEGEQEVRVEAVVWGRSKGSCSLPSSAALKPITPNHSSPTRSQRTYMFRFGHRFGPPVPLRGPLAIASLCLRKQLRRYKTIKTMTVCQTGDSIWGTNVALDPWSCCGCFTVIHSNWGPEPNVARFLIWTYHWIILIGKLRIKLWGSPCLTNWKNVKTICKHDHIITCRY